MLNENTKSRVPDITKFAVVITSLPRWAIAMMAADGFIVPNSWTAIHILSGVFGAAMSVAEGIALAYILSVFANTGKQARKTLTLYILALTGVFVATLAPSVYARAADSTVIQVMTPLAMWIWSGAVILSTIITAQAVGYAQSLERDLELTMKEMQDTFNSQRQELQFKIERKDEEIRTLNLEVSGAREQIAYPTVAQLPKPATQRSDPPRSKYYDKALEAIRLNPSISVKGLAEALGTSRPTTYNVLHDLETMGKFRKNGHMEVIESSDVSQDVRH